MAADQLSKNPPDGTVFGQSATDKISMYGGTPAVQLSGAAQAAVTRGAACGSVAVFGSTQTPAGILTITTTGLSFTVQSGTGFTWQLSGSNPSDVLIVNKPTSQAGLAVGNVRVSAANVAGVSFANISAATITPTAGEKYGVVALRGLPVLTAALTPAAVLSNSTAEQQFTVTGLRVGEVVQVMKPTDQAGLTILGARVVSANTLGINFGNPTAALITPTAAETYTVLGIGGLDAVNNDLQVGVNVGTPAGIATVTSTGLSVTLTGLAVADAVKGISKPSKNAGLGGIEAWVSAANLLGVSFTNPTAGALTPTALEVYNVAISRPNPAAPCVVYSQALTPSGVASLTTAEQGFTVTGLVSGSVVLVNKPSAQAGLGIGGARVSAANVLAITFTNTSTAMITPTAAEAYLIANFQQPIPDAGAVWIQAASAVQQNTSLLANAMRAALVGTSYIAGA